LREIVTEVPIDQIEPDGKGTGVFCDSAGNAKRAEVPFTMPGDLVLTRVKRKKRGLFPGPLLQVIQEAPERKTPRCPHFGLCGGCSLQHIPYLMQLKWKQQLINEFFRTCLDDSVEVRTIIGSPEWEYRNKMEFSFSQDKNEERYLGLMMQGSRGKVFQLKSCFLPSAWFAETLESVRAWWQGTALKAYRPVANSGTLRTLTLRKGITSGDVMVILTVSGEPEYAIRQRDLESFKALFEPSVSLYLKIHQAIQGQPTQIYEMHLQGPETISETLSLEMRPSHPVHFHISPSSFFQPNTTQAQKLYTEALRLAELKPQDIVYDLFCGTGTLGILAARFVKQVVGIELVSEAVLDGEANIKANGLENVTIISGDVEEVLKKRAFPAPSVVLLDPPRSGLLPSAIQQVIALRSPTVIYISCNPKTQARDIQAFLDGGYQLCALQPVDQFPHTPHIENIACLRKK
jgi:23S rRNA (uracil1939-C5)-methyltransferase